MKPLYPKSTESILVLYDLRDPEQWKRAGRDRRAWGRGVVEIHTLDRDHVVLEFRAGGVLEGTA